MNIRKTISLPKPLHDFAMRESRKLSKREKGVEKENLSMFVSQLIKDAREARQQAEAA